MIGSTIHIGNTCTGATGSTDCTTVRRKTSNIIFLMDRNQIADNKRTAKLLMRYFPFICKHNNRKRHRHTLISTSGIDNNRHRTSAHTRITSGGCPCTGSCCNTLSPYMHQRFSNLRSIVIIKSFLSNRRIQFNLSINDRLHIFHTNLIRKIKDIFNRKF